MATCQSLIPLPHNPSLYTSCSLLCCSHPYDVFDIIKEHKNIKASFQKCDTRPLPNL
uniref:Uncharacterized protein n=1 Tax=Rhizophora mucronata TaxID=61149 RepID=A0A2P2N6T0_RHIMU